MSKRSAKPIWRWPLADHKLCWSQGASGTLSECSIDKTLLGGRFGFFFFCSGAGEKEEASEEVAGGSVLIKNRGKGGGEFSEEEAWEGEGRWGNVCGDAGAKFLFWPEIPTKPFLDDKIQKPSWGRQKRRKPPPFPLCKDLKGFIGKRFFGGKLFLLTVGAFLLTVKLLRLQSLKALIRRTFPL